jgi:hypothetical protein
VLASTSLGSWAADASSTPQALGLVDNFTTFGGRFEAGNSGNTFAERFTFSVGDTVGQNPDAIVASASRSADVGLDITGLSLFEGNDVLLRQGRSLRSGAVDVWTLTGSKLSAGDYTICVDGNRVPDNSASFREAMLLVPVPEPEAYGMMLGGLGIPGFLARRRKGMRE